MTRLRRTPPGYGHTVASASEVSRAVRPAAYALRSVSESYAQIKGETQTLFRQAELTDWLASLKQKCVAEIDGVSEKTLLAADVETWVAELGDRFSVEPLSVLRGDIEAEDLGEQKIDVSRDPNRFIRDESQPIHVPGRKIVVHIPIAGDEDLLRCRASQFTMSPPRAAIGRGEIKLHIQWPHDRKPAIQTLIDELVGQIERHAQWQRPDIELHNQEIPGMARRAIEARRRRLLADHDHLDGLGIPIRRREDAPKTYAAPGIARRTAPTRSRAARPAPIEPVLVADLYEHILSVCRAMARGMERTPGDYASWDEEQLRDAFLVLLGTHYEGQASGETFNKAGKTDILVRVDDRNVFVAECKWWSGAAALAQPDRSEPSALDQLLSYTTWRDAKLALVVFVNRKQMSGVISTARGALERHPSFISWQSEPDEASLRCRVRMPSDEERFADLAVEFVHLPKS